MSCRKKYYALRQIRIAQEDYNAIKNFCAIRQCSMAEWYDHILALFIKTYQHNPPQQYFSSIKNGKNVSIWIKKEKIKIINGMAVSAAVSDARIIFTAVMWFLRITDKNTLHFNLLGSDN